MTTEPEHFESESPPVSQEFVEECTDDRPRRSKRRRKSSVISNSRVAEVIGHFTLLFENVLAGQSEIKQLLSLREPGKVELESDQGSQTEESANVSCAPDGPTEVELLLASEVERLRDELERFRSSTISNVEVGPSFAEDETSRILRAALEESEATIESLQAEIQDLKQSLQAASTTVRRASTPAIKQPMQSLTWDEQKKRLMEEGGDESTDETPMDSHSSPEEQVPDWEELLIDAQKQLALKEAEIASLREQLAAASAAPNLDEVREQMLNADQVIQQEREKLRSLQEEMEEKLRKAEVDLSLERARLARDRQAIEELQQQLARNPSVNDPAGTPKKRRWLSSLGLDGK